MTHRSRPRRLAFLLAASLPALAAMPALGQMLYAQAPQPVQFGPVPQTVVAEDRTGSVSPVPNAPANAPAASNPTIAPVPMQQGAPASADLSSQNAQNQPRVIPNVPAVPARPVAPVGPVPTPMGPTGLQPQVVPGQGPAVGSSNPITPSGAVPVVPAPPPVGGAPRPIRPVVGPLVPAVPILIEQERQNPFQSPTSTEQRNALQARIIQNAIDASVRTIEERMRAEIENRIKELEAETQQRIRSQQAAVPQIPPGQARPGVPGQPGQAGPNGAPRVNFVEFRSTHSLVRRTDVGVNPPDNWRLVGCVNGRAIYNDGKVTFEHDDGEAGSHCGRRRPDSGRLQ
jgi:hypothetical protein